MRGYTEIFETMLNSLRVFAESEKPLNVKEIQYEFGLHIRTAQRIAKALEDAGWITSKKTRFGKFFTATDKAKALFKKDEEITAQNNAVEFFKVHGLKKVREVVDGAGWATEYCAETNEYLDYSEADHVGHCDKCIAVKDLKRLVVSVDRVNEHGGYLAAKELLSFSIVHQEAFGKDAVSDENINLLKDSIKAHKTIYGGE